MVYLSKKLVFRKDMDFLQEYLPMTKAEESGLRPCVLLREREIFLIEC